MLNGRKLDNSEIIELLEELNEKAFNKELIRQLILGMKNPSEYKVYEYIQCSFAYNSLRLSDLTIVPAQIRSIYDTGTFTQTDKIFEYNLITETKSHFNAFNRLLQTIGEELSEKIIKEFHYYLKIDDNDYIINDHPVGEYKVFPNRYMNFKTSPPETTAKEIAELIKWYKAAPKNFETLARFHSRFTLIQPFKGSNGRVMRLILFRECLRNGLAPVLIRCQNKSEMEQGIKITLNEDKPKVLTELYQKDQEEFLTNLIPLMITSEELDKFRK